MKGGSREAKGLKSTGGGRTWYGKRETLTPVSLLTELVSQNSQWLIFIYSRQIITKGRNSRHYLTVIYTRPHKLRSFDFHHVKARVNYLSSINFPSPSTSSSLPPAPPPSLPWCPVVLYPRKFRAQIQTIRTQFVFVRTRPVSRFAPFPARPSISGDQSPGDFMKQPTCDCVNKCQLLRACVYDKLVKGQAI